MLKKLPDQGFPAIEKAAPLSILDHIDLAIVLADRFGQVGYINRAGAVLLTEDRGMRLSEGHLKAWLPTDTGRLYKAIGQACRDGKSQAVMVQGRENEKPFLALVFPMRVDGCTQAHAIAVLLVPKGVRDELLEMLHRLFGLTTAEAVIAVALGNGEDLSEVAQKRGVSVNTLRSQIASVMAKMHVRRPAQVISMVARLDAFI